MWIVPVREYNEDPVFFALVSPTTLAARRRTIYVFHDRGATGVDRIAIGGTTQGGLYTVVRDPAAASGTAGATRRLAGPVRYTPVSLGEAPLYRDPVSPVEPPSGSILP